jgi:periplasmic protein TonB
VKNWIVLILLVLGLQELHAQEARVFLNDRFEVVNSQSNSRYYRIQQHLENQLFDVEIHYISGGLKMKGQYLVTETRLEHGDFEYYYKNGHVESKGKFKYGNKIGPWERYDWDGTRKGDRFYPEVEVETVVVEKSPAAFPEGYGALLRYIDSSSAYPVGALKNNIEGTVKVSFNIEADGSLHNLNLVQSIHPLLDNEAKRLIQSMPVWIPGRRNGEAVPSTFIMPIHFHIDQGEPMVYIEKEI